LSVKRADAREALCQLAAEVVATGERSGCDVTDLGLVPVYPHRHLERQIERREASSVE
jgi:hypothetical protein